MRVSWWRPSTILSPNILTANPPPLSTVYKRLAKSSPIWSPQRGPSATTTGAPTTTSRATATRTRSATRTAAVTTTAARKNVSNHHQLFRRLFSLVNLLRTVYIQTKDISMVYSGYNRRDGGGGREASLPLRDTHPGLSHDLPRDMKRCVSKTHQTMEVSWYQY